MIKYQKYKEKATEILALTGYTHEDDLYFHDGTERAIQRPVDPDQQRAYYSGNKKGTRWKTTCAPISFERCFSWPIRWQGKDMKKTGLWNRVLPAFWEQISPRYWFSRF